MANGRWVEIEVAEFNRLAQRAVLGETLSDPDGDRFGTPHMLTAWDTPEGEPLVRHQCWPVGHVTGFARPCLYERWEPAVLAEIGQADAGS